MKFHTFFFSLNNKDITFADHCKFINFSYIRFKSNKRVFDPFSNFFSNTFFFIIVSIFITAFITLYSKVKYCKIQINFILKSKPLNYSFLSWKDLIIQFKLLCTMKVMLFLKYQYLINPLNLLAHSFQNLI